MSETKIALFLLFSLSSLGNTCTSINLRVTGKQGGNKDGKSRVFRELSLENLGPFVMNLHWEFRHQILALFPLFLFFFFLFSKERKES